jgi:hypothetical protein
MFNDKLKKVNQEYAALESKLKNLQSLKNQAEMKIERASSDIKELQEKLNHESQ